MNIRVLLLAAVFILSICGDVLAETVTFGRSQIDVVGSDGRHHPMAVEMAVTPEQLSQGLMFRKNLPPETGMLFDFGRPRQVSMWMKNTLIPLDMLFMDSAGRVIHVEEYTIPGNLQPLGPSDPVLGVLEVSAGTVRRLGLRPGDRVVHPLFGAGR